VGCGTKTALRYLRECVIIGKSDDIPLNSLKSQQKLRKTHTARLLLIFGDFIVVKQQ
jgi:hypothetical protein